jgi:hypothetical protein
MLPVLPRTLPKTALQFPDVQVLHSFRTWLCVAEFLPLHEILLNWALVSKFFYTVSRNSDMLL